MNRAQRRVLAKQMVRRGAVRGSVVRSARRDVAAALKGVASPEAKAEAQERRAEELGIKVPKRRRLWTPRGER